MIFQSRSGIDDIAAVNAIQAIIQVLDDVRMGRVRRNERLGPSNPETLPAHVKDAVIAGHLFELMSFAQRIARTTVTVLITGESGTGKEILARAIHAYSDRAKKAFVPFNCSAIPRDLMETQLFGHRRGAFTGAEKDHAGIIRTANEGTLFLDEIGEMSLDLQPKLLRFREPGELSPLGEPAPLHV